MASQTSPNSNTFLLPDLGEGLEEAELLEWCVEEGQEVKESEMVAKMETAKAVVEVYSPRAGTIETLHGKPGETIKVAAPFITYKSEAGEPQAPSPPDNGKTAESAPPDESLATSVDDAFDIDGLDDDREDAGTVVGMLGDADEPTLPGGEKVRAAPAVRRLARDLNVDITKVKGTGIGGRITSRDVQSAAAEMPPTVTPKPPQPVRPTKPAAQPGHRPAAGTRWPSKQNGSGLPPRRIPMLERKETPPIPPGEESIRIPFRGVRRIIAQHLRHSIGHAVHFTIMDDADVTALEKERRRLIEVTRERMSLLPLVACAACRVLSGRDDVKFNRLNSTVDDDTSEIIQHRAVHLGIATDTEEGLMVPVIKDADKLGLMEMNRKIHELAKKARERNIKRDELVGSTFTISNFGSLHGRYGTPIINYPEACILAIGRAREGVVVQNHMIGVGMLLPLSLSCDHRVIDGGTAAQALARIIELLQNPEDLLAAKQ
jgi:pyruvate dehydrogenase E2 component (dihydrolipoamide acetyltransferase)